MPKHTRKTKQETRTVLVLAFVLLFAAATIHAMFWTLNTFDPAKAEYRNLELQFGFQLMHMLLFFWMLIAVTSIFWRFYKNQKK